ncbi:hypothetical protein DFO67_10463 [Modicisalibacter xianhensis]|uniref:dATP/dGTP diphosphohydrolase N-terminal domain-containing protein n=1 Tax=Modicisalibacter xianhensis TaxID=442341 RepID=A0A4R8FVF8_9GAMM|nr:dATP/dGTP diphosphohydrolase domain-containing protein [Halomonas xianhensis]TDX30808.1 hypothetical protein DFO67_10463 [Halomonas xianhensis]
MNQVDHFDTEMDAKQRGPLCSVPAGMKFDTDKPRMDLLLSDMPRALTEVGKVLTFGAAKYAPGNWQYVENAEERYRAAGFRHDLALSMGEQHDSETGLLHLAHEACCVLFRLELALRELEATHD